MKNEWAQPVISSHFRIIAKHLILDELMKTGFFDDGNEI